MAVSRLNKQGLTCWAPLSLLPNSHITEKEKCFGRKRKKTVAEDKIQYEKYVLVQLYVKKKKTQNKKLNFLYQQV